jgi:hypothetical protein
MSSARSPGATSVSPAASITSARAPSAQLHGHVGAQSSLLARRHDPDEPGPANAPRAADQIGPGREHRVAAHGELDLGTERVVHPYQRGRAAAHPRPGGRTVEHEHVTRTQQAEVERGGRADHARADHYHVRGHRSRPMRRSASTRLAAL